MTDDNSSNPPEAPNAPPEPPPQSQAGQGHDLEQTGFQPESAPPVQPTTGHDMERTGFIEEGSSAPPPPSAGGSDLAIDSIVDERYRIEEKLGEGAMGTIYLVKEVETRENLALKTLSPALRGNPEAMKSLAKEVATARKLSHGNLLQIYTLETRGQLPYLVMEYVDGGDLEVRRRAAGGKLSEEETCEKTLATLEALDYLHEHNFVHLDVKPQNVMLTREGQAKLTDYGIAKSIGESDADSQGTPLYMAPELIQSEPTDRRTDIYAAGVMFYYLLMGRFPFGSLRDATPESVRAWHLSEKHNLPGLPPKWMPIISKCVAKNAGDRFATCQELITAIRTVMKGDRELPEPSSNRTGMFAIVGVIAALAIGGSFMIGGNEKAPKSTNAVKVAKPAPTQNVGVNNGTQDKAEAQARLAKIKAEAATAKAAQAEAESKAAVAKVAADQAAAAKVAADQAAVAKAAAAKVAAVQATPGASGAASSCAHAAGFTGQWQMTTVVQGEKRSAIGVNGYYQLGLNVSECNVSGQLVKLGYSRTTFPAHKRQKGSLNFTANAAGNGSSGNAASTIARSNGGSVLHMRLYMTVSGGTMTGYWLYTGSSFAAAPYWGSFKAIRDNGQRAAHSQHDYVGAKPAGFIQLLNGQLGR